MFVCLFILVRFLYHAIAMVLFLTCLRTVITAARRLVSCKQTMILGLYWPVNGTRAHVWFSYLFVVSTCVYQFGVSGPKLNWVGDIDLGVETSQNDNN